MVHNIPWAGHLSSTKSFERIAARFCWPGLYRDVQEYCKLVLSVKSPVAGNLAIFPFSLPVIEVPFTRIAMDFVGPLERTQAGYKYTLLRLGKVTARPIAQALLQAIF